MAETAPQTQDSFLRVSADKVGRLMDMVGELGLVSAEILHRPDIEELELDGFENFAHRLELLIREIQDESSGLRLVPVGTVFKRMQRVVRDLQRQTGKKIELLLEGEETEVDKVVVDSLYDPLVHIVRNSADHGLESPEIRKESGKGETGRITLCALQQGGEVQITIQDNGQGLNN
jgi:two-component system chemotaxis sensor kinase CheA